MSGWENPRPSVTVTLLYYVKFRIIFFGIYSTQSFDSIVGERNDCFQNWASCLHLSSQLLKGLCQRSQPRLQHVAGMSSTSVAAFQLRAQIDSLRM